MTFLFTDIEGSTTLWEQHPEAMDRALRRHDDLLRDAISRHDGVIFATAGDGLAAAFSHADDALAAALASQACLRAERWPEGVEIRVRMGLHSGRALERDGDYFGQPVNRAARLMGAAHGGQVVLSDLVAEEVEPPPDVKLIDLGHHQLRGLSEPMRVFGVCSDDVEWPDRPLASGQSKVGNLPIVPTELVGRVDLLRRQAREIAQRRLVTLTGAGGVGKTRAAIELGWLSVDKFRDGVWIVDLAPIGEPSVVISAVASSLGIAHRAGRTMLESIVDALADRAELLIIDNCEHVLSAAAELAGAIIAGCPRVTILATSREPLRVLGERVVRVPSLDPTQAVELFRERAAASDDAVQFAAEDAATIRGICERLDGIPLAIELAASRLRSLTLDDLAVRLDDRFRVLSGSGRLAPERHHTMRATVAWSYQLLAESERIVFDRLAVFAGTFDLRAVEQVCAHPSLAVNRDVPVDPDEVLDVMSSLVDKSMVNVERDQRTMRYRLLETLRQFAEQRLTDRGEIRTLRDLHLNHYLRVADDARPLEMGPSQLEADAIFEREWDNIRSAVAWAGATGRIDFAEQLIWSAFPFAVLRMRYELEEWAVRLIEKESLDRPVPGRIVVTAAGFAMFAAEWERSLPLCQETVARASDPESRALAWHSATISSMMLGRIADAKEARDRAQAALAETDDPFVRYWVLYSGMTVAVSTDRTSVPMWVDRLREHAENTGAPWMFPAVHMARGNLALLEGDHDRALESFRRVVEVSHTAHSMLDEGMGASRVITAALARTDAVFDDEIVEMLRLIRDTKSWTVVASACESIANRLARYGRLEPAAVMLGGLLAEPTSAHRANLRAETTELVGRLTDARSLIERGAGMTPADLVDYAFEQVHDLVASQ